MIAPAVAFSCILISISMSPWFSWTENALSDLGVGEAALVFNSGLMISGALAMIFAAGLFSDVGNRALARVGVALLFLDAVAMFGIGLFPETAGVVHFYFSVAFFALFPISLFLLGANAIMTGFKKFGLFTIATGVLAALPWLFSWNGAAIPEMLSALVVSIWMMKEGARLYLEREK